MLSEFKNVSISFRVLFHSFMIVMMKSRLRDTIEELRRSLQPKESALEALQQSLLEKEQVCISWKWLKSLPLLDVQSPARSCVFIHG